jgi:hypothetical protein
MSIRSFERAAAIVLLVAAAICVAALVPVKEQRIAACEVKVVDQDGQPLAGMTVVERWKFEEPYENLAYRTTDKSGMVTFPPRTQKNPALSLRDLLKQPDAGVVVFGHGYGSVESHAVADLAADAVQEQKLTIRLVKCPNQRHGVNCSRTDDDWGPTLED